LFFFALRFFRMTKITRTMMAMITTAMTIPMMAPIGNFFLLLFLAAEETILVLLLRVSRTARASTGKRAERMENSTNAKLVVLRSIFAKFLGKMGVSVFVGL
jgi:hypothetical protein